MPNRPEEAEKIFDKCIGDIERVTLIDNYIIDIIDGVGMVIDSSSCHLELNQMKKNALGGMLITSTVRIPRFQFTDTARATGLSFGMTNSRIDQIRTFSHVYIDNCTST